MRNHGTIEEIAQIGAEFTEEVRAFRIVSAVLRPEDFDDGYFDDAASSGIFEGESVPDEPIQQPRQSTNNRYRYQESTLVVPGVGLINSPQARGQRRDADASDHAVAGTGSASSGYPPSGHSGPDRRDSKGKQGKGGKTGKGKR